MPEADVNEFTVIAQDGCILRGVKYTRNPAGKLSGTVLCLHGMSSDSNAWRLIAPTLAESGLTVLVPDMRGHGYSGYSTFWKMNLKQFHRDALQICIEMGETEVLIATQSYGGLVGLECVCSNQSSVKFRGLVSFAPPWVLRKTPIKQFPKRMKHSIKQLRNLARNSGYLFHRRMARQDYSAFRDAPDFHLPLMLEEARNIAWIRYARLLLTLQFRHHLGQPDWAALENMPVYLYLAKSDWFVNNSELKGIANRTGWPLEWIDCNHVSPLTNTEHADVFSKGIIQLLLSDLAP